MTEAYIEEGAAYFATEEAALDAACVAALDFEREDFEGRARLDPETGLWAIDLVDFSDEFFDEDEWSGVDEIEDLLKLAMDGSYVACFFPDGGLVTQAVRSGELVSLDPGYLRRAADEAAPMKVKGVVWHRRHGGLAIVEEEDVAAALGFEDEARMTEACRAAQVPVEALVDLVAESAAANMPDETWSELLAYADGDAVMASLGVRRPLDDLGAGPA